MIKTVIFGIVFGFILVGTEEVEEDISKLKRGGKQDENRQQRLKIINERRKAQNKRRALQQGKVIPDTPQEYSLDGQLSKTQKIKAKEHLEAVRRQINNSKQFMFELDQLEEFVVNFGPDQSVMMHIKIYVLKNNGYSEIENAQKQAPVRVFVYQNNNRIVSQRDFYFEGLIEFTGKKDSTYTIRFYTNGSNKMLIVRQNFIIHREQIENVLSSDTLKEHQLHATKIKRQLQQTFSKLNQGTMLTHISMNSVNHEIDSFIWFEVLQTCLCCVVGLAQIYLISAVLKTQSIV